MAAAKRAPTTILGGHGHDTGLSTFASIASPPNMVYRPANDNTPMQWGKAPRVALLIAVTVSVAALLLALL